MDLKIAGRRALVTGASRGLGKTMVELLAAEGARVCAVARTGEQLEQLLSEIGGQANGHFILPLDLMEPDAIVKLHKAIEERFGIVDIIIHNLGGTLGIRDPISTMDGFEKVWRFNLGIAIEINRLCIPAMKENQWGRIVHVSSSAAVTADGSLPYSSAKAAVNTYVRGIGREMAKYGIIITALVPGPFVADGGHWDNIQKNDPERYQRFINERMALPRLGNTKEIGQIITVLCSEYASFMPGAIVPVEGGYR
jgi:NAD(P)-dependent dehydrogenase (short-subunit alcohol dehydrogenase family)